MRFLSIGPSSRPQTFDSFRHSYSGRWVLSGSVENSIYFPYLSLDFFDINSPRKGAFSKHFSSFDFHWYTVIHMVHWLQFFLHFQWLPSFSFDSRGWINLLCHISLSHTDTLVASLNPHCSLNFFMFEFWLKIVILIFSHIAAAGAGQIRHWYNPEAE